MDKAQEQQLRAELEKLRSTEQGRAHHTCDAFWECIESCMTLGCADQCGDTYPDCCSTELWHLVREIFAKYGDDRGHGTREGGR